MTGTYGKMPTGIYDLKEDFIDRMREVGGQQMVDHSFRVADLMIDLAEVLGEDTAEYDFGGRFHDYGKVYQRAEVMQKTGKLTPAEKDEVKHHVMDGQGILWNLRMWAKNGKQQAKHKAAAIACSNYHHAWYNGAHDCEDHAGGYYNGMKYREEYTFKGEAIPKIARACAVCDVFEAITAQRSYDPARSPEEALDIMANGYGTQFDPQIFVTFFAKVVGFSREEIKNVLMSKNVI